jgi:hypothetical protein
MNEQTAVYMYGLLAPTVEVEGLKAVEDGCDVILISDGSVACAATIVGGDAWLSEEHARATALAEWITPRAWRHHEVLRMLHSTDAVVPLKFGTLCSDVDAVKGILGRLHHPIVELLEQFRGRDEWTLRTIVDEAALSSVIQQRNPDLLALQDDGNLPAGRAYFLRKQLQKTTSELMTRYLDLIHVSLRDRLTGTGWRVSPVTGPHGARRAGTDLALLVDRALFSELERVLEELESEHSGVTFELVGPWPPYSFTDTLAVDAASVN